MNIKGLVHVNINCSDFDLSLKFYELLGFQKVLEVPEKNTPEVAAAVGMPPYTVKGALIILQNSTMNYSIQPKKFSQKALGLIMILNLKLIIY